MTATAAPAQEVGYLRDKQIMVPDVAEVENIFMLPEVIKIMARKRGRDGAKIMRRVERDVMRMFKRHSEEQALQHVRHKVKRDVECKIDARFRHHRAGDTPARPDNETAAETPLQRASASSLP